MATDGSKRPQISATPPPRKLNVEKFAEARASELNTLHSIVTSRLNNDFRSRRSKRRRTTSFDNRISNKRRNKKRNLGVDDKTDMANLGKDKKFCRRTRRRMVLRMNPEHGFSTSGDGTKRLRTHVWHAKRFTMTKLWGFHLPLGLHGRGMGSRALLKWYRNGVLVHDASYYAAVQLEGPEDSLVSILQMVLVPSPSSRSQDAYQSVISGVIYDTAILHPLGSSLKPIAPVTYMWRPHFMCSEDYDAMDHHKLDRPSTYRQLWVWLHHSAFTEGYNSLKLACQKEMDERGTSINCFSLEGQIAKLEVMGSKAFKLLQKILHPITCTSENLWQLKKHSVSDPENDTQIKTSSVFESNKNISPHGIISLTVKDPRMLCEERIVDVPELLNKSVLCDIPVTESKDDAALIGISDNNGVFPSYSRVEGHGINSGSKDLWDVSNGVSPPIEDNFLCMERHHLRMDNFGLDDSCSGMLNTSSKVQCLRSCPIMLLKDYDRWSIVLPLSWVRAFWIPLVSNGAHVIGLREKHWIACEVGLPLFPLDFPDCSAYSCFMMNKADQSDRKTKLCPPLTIPFKIPIPTPWNSIQVSLNKRLDRVENNPLSTERNVVISNQLSSSDSGTCNTSTTGNHSKSFDGVVARTSLVLINFMNDIDTDLLLFPKAHDRKSRILEFLKYEAMLDQHRNGTTQISYGSKLCFVRVLLHAYKEGVFEEGAVVCAPFVTDISLWTSRSNDSETRLKLPESSVRQYFKEQPSSTWELNIPEDDAVAREFHRWPIGFVTNGFVRGSKKPVAEGFCEAVLLARLREGQWKAIPAKKRRKEIYVLVRNLRSSAYRLALATIVLEQQEEDTEFM